MTYSFAQVEVGLLRSRQALIETDMGCGLKGPRWLVLAMVCSLTVMRGIASATPPPTPTPQTILDHPIRHLLADPQRARMYVTSHVDNAVTVIDTNSLTVLTSIPIGSNPEGLS